MYLVINKFSNIIANETSIVYFLVFGRWLFQFKNLVTDQNAQWTTGQ